MVQTISPYALGALIRRRLARARAAGRHYVRDAVGFETHLVTVACVARSVAGRLCQVLPPARHPDPRACFLAGAWHDAGKIWNGDDYHEITGALELLRYAEQWRLVRGPAAEVSQVVHCAARTILPHFALYEQLQSNYAPASGTRAHVPQLCAGLVRALGAPVAACDLLPRTTDAFVLIYSDLVAQDGPAVATSASALFAQRWTEIAHRTTQYDPALAMLLPDVAPRLRGIYDEIAACLMARP
jgi:hypothetical protein